MLRSLHSKDPSAPFHPFGHHLQSEDHYHFVSLVQLALQAPQSKCRSTRQQHLVGSTLDSGASHVEATALSGTYFFRGGCQCTTSSPPLDGTSVANKFELPRLLVERATRTCITRTDFAHRTTQFSL